jgi:hypothetical protein
VLHASLEFRTLLCAVGVCTHKQHFYVAFERDMHRSFDEVHRLAHTPSHGTLGVDASLSQ